MTLLRILFWPVLFLLNAVTTALKLVLGMALLGALCYGAVWWFGRPGA